MTDIPFSDIEDRDVLAGELALRLLSPAEEARAMARVASEPAFAAEVEAWNERLAAFVAEIAPVRPSPGLWARVEAATAGSANDNGRLAFWRNWAIGSTGLMVASLAAVAVMLAQPPREVQVVRTVPAPAAAGVTRVATLTLTDGGAPAVTLAYDTATGNLFVAPTQAMAAGGAGVPHLWLVKPDGGVQLVGAIQGDHTSTRNLSAVLLDAAGEANAVAISIEAPGHTPAADKPDGPVVASGELQRL